MTVPYPPGSSHVIWCELFVSLSRVSSPAVKVCQNKQRNTAKNFDKRIVPDLLRLMCVIQKRLYFNSLWAKHCPRTCPSLRIERSLILQYPPPVCNLEYLPGFVLERKSTLHQMSAEKEHWVLADQSEWVVLKELNNGFQQC